MFLVFSKVDSDNEPLTAGASDSAEQIKAVMDEGIRRNFIKKVIGVAAQMLILTKKKNLTKS